jgi:twitching motility protein PilU
MTDQAHDIQSLLRRMVSEDASDMFITASLPPSFKVHGKVKAIAEDPLTPEDSEKILYSVMNDEQCAEFERTQECNFALNYPDIGRFRVNAFRQKQKTGMILRKIETQIPTIEELGLPPIIKDLAMTKRGLIIVVGATGSGKSSTLAAMIGHRNHNSTGHIISIEDPIEFVHEHDQCVITQREVGVDTDSFEAALKNTLRQAPDVILIGEIRSRETMQHAITFAETGHLCLATLHANNANQALDRIINFFPEDRRDQLLLDLSLNLKATIAQQLVPTPDHTGRKPVFEILLNSPFAAKLIRKGDVYKLKELMGNSDNLGMKTFDQSLYELYINDEISYDDAIHHSDHPNELRLMVKLNKDRNEESLDSSLEGVTLIDPNEHTD